MAGQAGSESNRNRSVLAASRAVDPLRGLSSRPRVPWRSRPCEQIAQAHVQSTEHEHEYSTTDRALGASTPRARRGEAAAEAEAEAETETDAEGGCGRRCGASPLRLLRSARRGSALESQIQVAEAAAEYEASSLRRAAPRRAASASATARALIGSISERVGLHSTQHTRHRRRAHTAHKAQHGARGEANRGARVRDRPTCTRTLRETNSGGKAESRKA